LVNKLFFLEIKVTRDLTSFSMRARCS